MKTLLEAALLAACALSPAPLFALPDGSRDLAPIFAGCLGRYSAQMEDAWNAYAADGMAQERRNAFEALLDAALPAATLTGPQILQIRLEAKFAQARLLSTARFNTDARLKRRAQAQAAMALRQCEALLL